MALSTLIFSLALLGAYAPAAEIEYVTPEQQQSLETLFDQASFSPTPDKAASIQAHPWTCDMYGVRSHLQVQRGLHLYKWSPDGQSAWQNSGAQLISKYSVQKSELVGVKDRLQDQVKLTRDGQLVSRLSVTAPKPMVIAYSVCR